MKSINSFIIQYLKWTSPIAFLAAALSVFGYSGTNLFYDVIGVITIAWIIFLIYMVFSVALSPQMRDSFVRWLANIKESDEREMQIAGNVSKKTFILTTGLLILFLFLSALRIDIYRDKKIVEQGRNGGMVTFGMALRIIETDSADPVDYSQRDYILKYHGLPLTADGALLAVLVLQLGAFYIFSRKETEFSEKG